MNAIEKILFAVLATAAQDAPIFIHSTQGTVILNASEILLANLIAAFGPKPTPAPTS